jgi:hypothetical protein
MATEADKINTGALATLTVVGTAATVAIAFAVTALVRYEAHSVSSERSAAGDAEVRNLKASQLEKLNAAPRWADETRTKVSLPIERAMGLVVSDLQKDPRKATPPAPPGVEVGTGAPSAADAGAEAADAAAPAPEGAAPTEVPRQEAPKPEDKKTPDGKVGDTPVAPSPAAPPSPAPPSQPQ